MDMGNEESYQTIFVPDGEMTPYRGCGVGTCHRVNSPKEKRTKEIPGPPAKEILNGRKRGVGPAPITCTPV